MQVNKALPKQKERVAHSIYPSMSNVEDVLAFAEHCLPITSLNELTALLKLQQNTIAQLMKDKTC